MVEPLRLIENKRPQYNLLGLWQGGWFILTSFSLDDKEQQKEVFDAMLGPLAESKMVLFEGLLIKTDNFDAFKIMEIKE